MVYEIITKDGSSIFSHPEKVILPEYGITVQDILELSKVEPYSAENNYVPNMLVLETSYSKLRVCTACINDYGSRYYNHNTQEFDYVSLVKAFGCEFRKINAFEKLMKNSIKTIVV